MFKSEPICVLKAGPTIDGRDIAQKVIDDIANTYDPIKYPARINDNHDEASFSGGTVLSVEKRNDELWAEIKPNSYLLRNIESGQLLHTSCEYIEDFANTGKAYLTGLAFTDKPASLYTTQVHLSAQHGSKKAIQVSTGQTLNYVQKLSQNSDAQQEVSLLQKLFNLLTSAPDANDEQLTNQEESEDMSKKTEELLEQSIEQNKELTNQLSQLVTCLSASNKQDDESGDETDDADNQESKDVTELKGQVTELSSQVETLSCQLEKLSKLTDEQEREPAGADGEDEPYL